MTAADPSVPFGTLLRRFRRNADLTQVQLAEHIGLAAVTIRAYENGVRKPPRTDDLGPFCDALALTTEDCALLTSAAKRSRTSWSDPFGAGQDSPPAPAEMPPGLTAEAQEAVAQFNTWYRPWLAKAVATQLSVVVWCPVPETDGPVASKRRVIRTKLQELGHLLVEPSPLPLQGKVHGEDAERQIAFEHVDLILVLAEDDPGAVEQATQFCQRAEILHKTQVMLPERFESLVEADLDMAIYGYNSVFWYDNDDLEVSNLVKRSLRCSEARRKAKAFVRSV